MTAHLAGSEADLTAARHLRGPRLSITVFHESSIRPAIPLRGELENIDPDVSLPVWFRRWSP